MHIFHLIKAMYRATREKGSRITQNELTQYLERELEKTEHNHFLLLIGKMAVSWAWFELVIDKSNGFIIATFEPNDAQFPVSLRSKLAFYRKQFGEQPLLEPYRNRALAIVERAHLLKEIRHDIIHGHSKKLD
jgi:hypothetical protein